jgi:hypothetical protein
MNLIIPILVLLYHPSIVCSADVIKGGHENNQHQGQGRELSDLPDRISQPVVSKDAYKLPRNDQLSSV